MVQVIVIVNLVAAAGFLLYYRSMLAIPNLLGLLLGGLASLARVIVLENTVNRIILGKVPSGFAQLSYMLRFAMALVALMVGAIVEGIGLAGVVVGIFSYQLGTYSLKSTLSEEQNQITKKIADTRDGGNAVEVDKPGEAAGGHEEEI